MDRLSVPPGPMAAVDPCSAAVAAPLVIHPAQKLVTVAIVAGPAVALAVLVPLLWGHAVDLSDLLLAAVFYLITGFGITIGFHRLFTHRGVRAATGCSRSPWPSWVRWPSRDR